MGREPIRASEFPGSRFWAVLEQRHPEERSRRAMRMRYFWQRAMPDLGLVVTMYVTPERNACGVFLGQNARFGVIGVAERLRPLAPRINAALGLDPALGSDEFPFVSRWQVNCFAEDNWPAMADWMVTEAGRYERVLRALLASQEQAEASVS